MDIISYFSQGGFFMFPILGCLICGVALIFYKMIEMIRINNYLKNVTYFTLKDNIVHDAIQNEIQKLYTEEMYLFDKGMSNLSTLISLAPMLGFTGTVFGMIMAFQNIKSHNDISPAIVADGIEKALLTTLFGLIVAMILQAAYNYFKRKIEKSEVQLINKLMFQSSEIMS